MINNEESADDPRHWKNWITTGNLLNMIVMVVLVSVSYVKQGAKVEESIALGQANATLIAQLHESMDQIRMRQSMTPEAAQRVTALEVRLMSLEKETAERSESINDRLARLETKTDDIYRLVSRNAR